MTAYMFLVKHKNDFCHDQYQDFINVFKLCYFSVNKFLNVYIYFKLNAVDENILTFKTFLFPINFLFSANKVWVGP